MKICQHLSLVVKILFLHMELFVCLQNLHNYLFDNFFKFLDT